MKLVILTSNFCIYFDKKKKINNIFITSLLFFSLFDWYRKASKKSLEYIVWVSFVIFYFYFFISYLELLFHF